jgi:hypothetical protein
MSDELVVVEVGAPTPESDAALRRWYLRWLERNHPGTTWRIRERDEPRPLPKAAP